jgi:Ca2+-binding EF-hand superfamily protein
MQENEAEEDFVSLFKSFGAIDINDVITVGNLDQAMKEEGENLRDEELQLIFEELAGTSKRAQQSAERRYARATGLTFHDFLLLLLAK